MQQSPFLRPHKSTVLSKSYTGGLWTLVSCVRRCFAESCMFFTFQAERKHLEALSRARSLNILAVRKGWLPLRSRLATGNGPARWGTVRHLKPRSRPSNGILLTPPLNWSLHLTASFDIIKKRGSLHPLTQCIW